MGNATESNRIFTDYSGKTWHHCKHKINTSCFGKFEICDTYTNLTYKSLLRMISSDGTCICLYVICNKCRIPKEIAGDLCSNELVSTFTNRNNIIARDIRLESKFQRLCFGI